VAASCAGCATGESIAKDEAFAGLLARVTPDTSSAVLETPVARCRWPPG
jgi:hypothetical protein